jgi:hypothetical protein
MAQYRNQQWSENLVAVSPGLTIVNSTICGNSKVTPEYNCYDLTLSNLGTVGVQITRIYINSTGSGCIYNPPTNYEQPCILNPISHSSFPAYYAFDQANQFINTGETNHTVAFALPAGVALPAPAASASLPPQNSIVIATSRGNVFSFQWPFQALPFLPTSAFSSGNMKVAYQGGFDSSKEPSFTGKATGSVYCHTEPVGTGFPVLPGYAEKLTGITGVTGSTLYFVNPWITGGNSKAVVVPSSNYGALYSTNGTTTLYIYVAIVNTGSAPYTPTAGSLDLTWYGSNHIDGYLLGVYTGPGAFWVPGTPNAPNISPGHSYYAIFKIVVINNDLSTFIGNPPWASSVQPGSPSIMFWGTASITNAVNNGVESVPSEGSSFFSGTILVSGLWIRYEAPSSPGSCA